METITISTEFEIISKVAVGGMGEVYKGIQKGVKGFEKVVAIKTLKPELSSNQKYMKKFVNEAKLVSDLVFENIAQIYQLQFYDDFYFFVQEYVEGISLADLILFQNSLKKRIPVEFAVYIASRIARGLSFAHEKTKRGVDLKIVHCDISPSNILLSIDGVVKITDFGIARALHIANDNVVYGKVHYISPEHARGEILDFKSDIYSLGIVLFNLLSNQLAREIVDSEKEMLEQAAAGIIVWDRLPNDLDPVLLNILRQMLAKNKEDRYSTTRELADELNYYIYKDGLGPTKTAFSDYLRGEVPYIFAEDTRSFILAPEDIEKTIRITQNLDN